MKDILSGEMKVELLKQASQMILACGDVKIPSGMQFAARQLGVPVDGTITYLDLLDKVYDHLLARVSE